MNVVHQNCLALTFEPASYNSVHYFLVRIFHYHFIEAQKLRISLSQIINSYSPENDFGILDGNYNLYIL